MKKLDFKILTRFDDVVLSTIGSKQPRVGTLVLGHSLVRAYVRSLYRSLPSSWESVIFDVPESQALLNHGAMRPFRTYRSLKGGKR